MRKIFIFILSISSYGISDQITWVAPNGSDNMELSSNWDPATVPTFVDDAIFDSTIANISFNPTETTNAFNAQTFTFPFDAESFVFGFDNQSLSLHASGFIGDQTDTTINIGNNNNATPSGNQIEFLSNSSMGSAKINLTNASTLTGSISGSLISLVATNHYANAEFEVEDNAQIRAENSAADTTTDIGGNISSYVTSSQILFNNNTNVGADVVISATNNGILSGSNSIQGSSVAVLQEHQLLEREDFNAGDRLSMTILNQGFNSNTGAGGCYVGAIFQGSQVQFDKKCTLGDEVSIEISNQGTNQGDGAATDFVGYVVDEQLYVGDEFQAGEDFTLSVTNTGAESGALGGKVIGIIDSLSGVTGNQVRFLSSCELEENAVLTIANSGTCSGTNTLGQNAVGQMNANQVVILGAFSAGSGLTFQVSNTGTDSSQGDGLNRIGNISISQLFFNETCTIEDNANINVTNLGTYSGSNVSNYNSIGSVGSSQLHFENNFIAGDGLTLNISNEGNASETGLGGDYVGTIINGSQAFFNGECSVGNNADLEFANAAINSSNCDSYVNVGSLLTDGQQLHVTNAFEAGDDLIIRATNQSLDNSTGAGQGSVVGAIHTGALHASQMHFGNSITVGDRASFFASNEANYLGVNTISGNQVGSLSRQQFYVETQFDAGDDLTFVVSNIGSDSANGQGSDFVGVILSRGQAEFNGTCQVGDGASFSGNNIGVSTGANVNNCFIGYVESQQLLFNDQFTAGENLDVVAFNFGVADGSGAGSNQVGTIDQTSQLTFNAGCTVGDDADFTALNIGSCGSGMGTTNRVGYVGACQIEVIGEFIAGKNLQMTAFNTGTNLGDISNEVGVVGNTQLYFDDTFTMGDGSHLFAQNSGTVLNSQIFFSQGFNITSGKAAIEALNQGVVSGYGIDIVGNSQGGNANIILRNSSLHIDTTPASFTIGELNGDNTSTVQSNPILVINTDASTNGKFAGDIQDFPASVSSLIKQGPGTQKLSGANTFTGLTTIQEGALVLTGSLAGSVVVDQLGILKGTGIIGGNLTNGGTVSPGESIGTLHVLGNYINNDGIYDVEVNGFGQSDLLDVTGTATLNGGIVNVTSLDSFYVFHQPYTIVEAENVIGTYAGTTSSAPLINAVLTYDSTHVYLTLLTNILQAAETHNQIAVATRLDGIENPNVNQSLLLNEMVNLSPEYAREALDSLSGFQHTHDLLMAKIIQQQFIRRLYDPVRSIVTAHCCDEDYDCDEGCGWSGWLETGGGFSNIHGNKNAHAFKLNSYEVTGGLQKTISSVTIGAAASYEYDHIHYDHGGAGKNSVVLAGLYGLYRPEKYYALVDATYSHGENKIRREISVGTLNYSARSKPEINNWAFYGEVGIDFCLCQILVQPFVGIEGGRTYRSHVREHQAEGWGLDIGKKHWSTTNSRLGVHVTSSKLCNSLDISLDLAWNRLLSCRKNRIRGQFIEFGDAFNIWGVDLFDNSIDYALTFSSSCIRGWEGLEAYIEVGGQSWQHAHMFNILGGIEFSW